MSHVYVTCDACVKENFSGRRFKCLICCSYNLCASCYESEAVTRSHKKEHPMQCILTRADYELHYGGDPSALAFDRFQSFTCPYCGKMGHTETTLLEHITSDHAETSIEVICPICAALPEGNLNYMTDYLASHLNTEHHRQNGARIDLLRQMGGTASRREVPVNRGRRTYRQLTLEATGGTRVSPLSNIYAPSNRDTVDPIAEFLQRSGGPHVAGEQINLPGISSPEVQELEWQPESQQARVVQLATTHRILRHTLPSDENRTTSLPSTTTTNTTTPHSSRFLLASLNEDTMTETESQLLEGEDADHSLFVQELLMSTLMPEGSPSSDEECQPFADIKDMVCEDIMPLDVALENLQLRESSAGKDLPPPPL